MANAITLGEAARVTAHEVMQSGAAALRRSVQEVADQVRVGINNVENARLARGWAGQVLIAAGKPRGVRAQAQTILDALRKQTMYVADPVHMEWVQNAVRTLCLKPGQCNPIGDCDDLTVAGATIMILIGIPAQLVEQHFDGAEQDHILYAVMDESGSWLKIDPSTDWPVGRAATATKEVWVDPLKDVAPQLVGLGRIATTYETRFGKTWASRDGGQSWVEVPSMGALGDTATTIVSPAAGYDTAANDLQNEVILAAAAADTYLAAKDYKGAVNAYQAAGQAGASGVGPEIDLAGAPNVTQPLTQQAWTLNAALAAVNAASPTSVDANLAQGYVKQMIALYQQAIAAGRRAIVAIVPPGSPPVGDNTGALKALGIAAGAGVAAGLAYYFWRGRRYASKPRAARVRGSRR